MHLKSKISNLKFKEQSPYFKILDLRFKILDKVFLGGWLC